MNSTEVTFSPIDNARLANMCGALDSNLKEIAKELDIRVVRKGESFTLSGEEGPIKLGAETVQLL